MSSKTVRRSAGTKITNTGGDWVSILNSMNGAKPSLDELKNNEKSLIKIPRDNNWLGFGNAVNPLSDILRPQIISHEMLIYPWLKHGDFILITGFGRDVRFAEKIFSILNFLGYSNSQPQVIQYNDIGVIPYQKPQSPYALIVNDQSNINNENMRHIEAYIKQLKGYGHTLICVFEHDNPKLRKMKVWDSIIKIGRGKIHENIFNLMQVNFLRCKTWQPMQNRTFSLVSCTPSNSSGYDTTKNLYFVEKYEELKQNIIQLFRNGRTAQETHKILVHENKVDISLPIINKLKKRWGLRSYRPEKKPRKPKTKKNQSTSSSSVE